MIFLNISDSVLFIPKVDRSKIDRCNLYQLILQNISTKEVIVFKLRDYSQGNPSHYRFCMAVPDYLKSGEYKMFLVSSAEWGHDDIDTNSPGLTDKVTDKGAIMANGAQLRFNGKLLVSGYFRALVSDASGDFTSGGNHIMVRGKSEDTRACGEICKTIDVIHTDLLIIYTDSIEEPKRYIEPSASESRKTFIEHERYQ